MFHVKVLICCNDVRLDGMEDQYSILIRFDTQDSTDKFYLHFNGRQYNSLEVGIFSLTISILLLSFCSYFLKLVVLLYCYLFILVFIQEEACQVLFTVDIQFTGYSGSLEHSQPSTTSTAEQPSCPVCLGMFCYHCKSAF